MHLTLLISFQKKPDNIKKIQMKQILLLLAVLFVSGCDVCISSKCRTYMNRHRNNYFERNTITFGYDEYGDINTNYPKPHHIKEQQYDAEDFRAGARHVCGAILERSGEDVCKEVGYTAIY